MNISVKAFLTIIFALITTAAVGQVKNMATKGTVYVFGVGDSMRDSTVFITSVQRIDSANLQKRTKLLLDRPYLSTQLKMHFAQTLNDPNRLCILYYAKSEKEATKKQIKVRKNYLDEGAIVKQLTPDEFKFTPEENAVYQSAGEEIDPGFSQGTDELE